ncbi:uncharacterized protein G2W53_004387 [Senna tora]|uniref:Uncharacterized protein n=1 Tax=Senna tora TaxID=362788 RepID=A0A834XD35_9FABA|nr:uncharacterized protein G2W53_004387 [Senna tora]
MGIRLDLNAQIGALDRMEGVSTHV